MGKKNILIISPHPDDMEIGMGGTVGKLITQGFNIVSFVVTDGRRSTSFSGLGEDEIAQIRNEEAKEAASILGIRDLIFLGLYDLKSSENQEEMKKKLEDAINHFRPVEIFTTHPTIDKHPTHQAVSRLLLEILDKKHKDKLFVPGKIWCYEVWTPFEGYDRIEDISEYIDKKVAAINAHKSQIEYKDYADGIKGLNRYRAAFNNTNGITDIKYAEVFIELSLENH
ncbi:MAG: PIG-L family deacetylase [Deltaproteobacteria bacterium]|nr:PIG-L family deacetylase [Deltaproteobacteria bacterium]